MECRPIGHIETPFDTPDDAPRQGVFDGMRGTVHVDEAYREGLRGFETGTEVVVVWWADQADRSVLSSESRGRGVFSTRSPVRPNPICITECYVSDVDEQTGAMEVTGVDMADGTPLLDLKSTLE